MNFLKKLTTAYLIGSVVMAGVFGLMAESWWMFAIILIVLLVFRCCERVFQPREQQP